MKKLNKLSLPAVILISSIILGGFFYASQINKQRSIERQQQIEIEQKEQDQLSKEFKEQKTKEEAEKLLNDCLSNARNNYSDRWYEECKAQNKLTSKCIDINELSYDEYLKKYGLTEEEYIIQRNITPTNPDDPTFIWFDANWDYITRKSDECSCRLSVNKADRFNESLEKDKDECFKRYPQN